MFVKNLKSIARICRLAGIIFILIAIKPSNLYAQTCSCGGPPLLGSLESPATAAGTWRFGLSYEFSSISDLFEGTNERVDDLVEREVNSGAFQIDYGLSSRFSLSTAFTLLSQNRRTSIASGGDFERVSGIGDALLLVKYNLLTHSALSHTSLALGTGVKAPLGSSTVRGAVPGLITPDMQPGTGAWDFVFWGAWSQSLNRARGLNIFGSATFRLTTTDGDRFQAVSDTLEGYRFGNELITNLGVGGNISGNLTGSLGLRYRWNDAHKTLGNQAPNSGGKWLNFAPGLNYTLIQSITLRGAGQIPIVRDVEGTQFTTSYSLSFSIFYTFAKSTPAFTPF